MAVGERSKHIVVIGAGAAGLAAARRLTEAGYHVRIVEARGRLGGRICSIHEPSVPVPIEAGAEFVHGVPPEPWQIIRAANIAAADVPDSHWQLVGGKVKQTSDFWDKLDQVLGRLTALKRDMPFSQFLKDRCRDIPAATRSLALGYVEGFNAADAAKISSLSIASAEESQEEIEADRTFRLLRGYDVIIQHLAAGLDPNRTQFQLNSQVKLIAWRRSHVRVSVESLGVVSDMVASKAVITLPLGVLKSDAVRFDPDPPSIRSAVDHLEMGHVIKLLIRFREPFWERPKLPAIPGQNALRDMTFLHSQGAEAAFPTWWTMLPVRTALLMGWTAGPSAMKLSGRPPADMLRLGLKDLAHATGLSSDELTRLVQDFRVFDWSVDPFARGAYSYVPLGGTNAVAAIARPVAATLYFAGEATHPGMSGTVAGAIASGNRAASQIINSR